MTVVLFPDGRTLSFYIRALAETYVVAYGGVIVSDAKTPQTVGECKKVVVGNCNLEDNISIV